MKVLMPLPERDFDPTEAAVTWKVLRDAGHTVRFATPKGERVHVIMEGPHGRGVVLPVSQLKAAS